MCKEDVRIGRSTSATFSSATRTAGTAGQILGPRGDRLGVSVSIEAADFMDATHTALVGWQDGATIRALAALSVAQPSVFLEVGKYGRQLLGALIVYNRFTVDTVFHVGDYYLDQELKDV